MEPISLFSCTETEYVEKIFLLLGKGKNHAKGLYADGFKKGKMGLIRLVRRKFRSRNTKKLEDKKKGRRYYCSWAFFWKTSGVN